MQDLPWRNCSVCTFMPKQDRERVLHWHPSTVTDAKEAFRNETEGNPAPVLVIDNASSDQEIVDATCIAEILLEDVQFIYTNTIRCKYEQLTTEQRATALSRCSVWTGHMIEGRAIIISTLEGLKQLKVEKEIAPGTIVRSPRLGLVLCVPPLTSLHGPELLAYKSKIQRMVKEAKLK